MSWFDGVESFNDGLLRLARLSDSCTLDCVVTRWFASVMANVIVGDVC